MEGHDVSKTPVEATAMLTGAGKFSDYHASLGARILDAWLDMRRSTRRLIEECPPEQRLLFYVLLSDIIFFLSWSLKTVVAPVSGIREQVPMEVSLWLVGALALRTTAMYVFSGIVTLVARLCGGTGTWKENRAGIFWGALVAAPFGFLMAVVTVSMHFLEPVVPVIREDWIALPPYWISLVPFIWFISQGLAEANGFRKNAISFLVMSGLALAALVAAMYLRATGTI